MAKTLEQLAEEIYKECLEDGEEITKDEAMEMAQMELGAKEIKNYAQAEKPKEKKKREVKLDEVKVAFIRNLFGNMVHHCDEWSDYILENIEIVNPQKEISFRIGNDEYSLNLVKHRPKK